MEPDCFLFFSFLSFLPWVPNETHLKQRKRDLAQEQSKKGKEPDRKSKCFLSSRLVKNQELNSSMLQLGPLKNDGDKKSWITHNEFISYDVDQIQLKCLFKCQFC